MTGYDVQEISQVEESSATTAPYLYALQVNKMESQPEKNELGHLIRQSRFLALGAIGIFSAFSGIINLQSSLNFDKSIGTTSLALAFSSCMFMNAVAAPILMQRFGAKTLLLISDFTFLLYTFANLYPSRYTLFPGAILLGVGEALIWPSITMFNTYFGSRYADCLKEDPPLDTSLKKENWREELRELTCKKTRWFTGKFFAMFTIYQIVGNLMSYVVLVFDKGPEAPKNATIGNGFWNLTNREKSLVCGFGDCYEYTTSNGPATSQDSQLDVNNATLKYALFAGYSILQIGALVFHKITLDTINRDKKKKSSSRRSTLRYFVRIFLHYSSPLQVLLAPINIYNGMMMAFLYGDLTRSYIACPLGVEQVGLAMTFFGIFGAIGCLAFQRFSASLGRNAFVGLFVLLEGSFLVFFWFWTPTAESPWHVYILAACCGFPDSIRQVVIAATYPEYFRGKENVAFSTLSLLTSVGYVIMFGVGTNICVSSKILILLVVLALSLLCYITAECCVYKEGIRVKTIVNLRYKDPLCSTTDPSDQKITL